MKLNKTSSAIVLAFSVFILCVSAQAQYTYTTNNGTITITRYTGSGGVVIIPSTISGLPVTSIGDSAFSSCSSLTSVTIPNTVTSLGISAFNSCLNMTSVTIGNSVTSIGDLAFVGCTSLTSISIPECVTIIGYAAFNSCTSLTSISIPDSVTSIGDWVFSDCTRLSAITVDALNSFYSSMDGILYNKSQTMLIQYPEAKAGNAYTIPNNVTSIGGGAFSGCTNLTSVTIPDSVTTIGNYAFSGCASLTIVTIPKPQLAAHPLVKEMLQDIQPTDLYSMMRQITGEEPVLVGYEAVVFTNRLTGSAPLRKATQFAFEHLQALGLQVHYQVWERAWESGPTYFDRNVVAIQPGVRRPEEIVVICAHFDDYSETNRAPGADDNGSGSAAVLTAAKIFSQYHFERTIHYVLFTGEEQHGLGSQEYVAQAVGGGSNIVAVLAPDMIGYASSALEPPTCSLTTWYAPDLGLEGNIGSEIEAMFTLGFKVEAMFTNVVAMYGLSNTVSCSFEKPGFWGIPSDAEFFFENGYSTLLLTHDHENSRIHSDEDKLEVLNFSYFTAMVQAIVGTAAHLAYPVVRNPFEVMEVANSDWRPVSDLGGSHFYAAFAVGASETNGDLQDFPWSEAPTNSPFNKELRVYSDPYRVPLQIDTRPPGSDTLFRVKLAVADATGTDVSGNTRLRFSPLTPTGNNRVYLARVHVDGRYLVTGKDFDCVTNLHEVVSAGGFLDMPSLVEVPDGAVYATCDISARLLNQDAANCRLRVASIDSPSIVLSTTAQMGAHIIDDLEVCTNLDPPIRWTLLKSYTNVVSPDATHFDSGWTEVVREVDASLLPEGTSHFFRLKRTWTNLNDQTIRRFDSGYYVTDKTSLQTNTLIDGSSYFSDPQRTNYPSRFYRLRSP